MPGSRFPLTTLPFTYIIDYGGGWNGHLNEADAFVHAIAEAPPHLLHVHEDVPIPNTAGAVIFAGTDSSRRMPPDEVHDRFARVSDMLGRLRAAGVQRIIPYICNQTIAGDMQAQRGIWEFYDHWDEYAELGIGPRPAVDPSQWLARERNGRPHFNYEMRHTAFTPRGMFRWAPCENNPHYNAYQRVIVTEIAKVGYDGVFVDNCNLNCYCEHCQAKFKRYLAAKYPAAELQRRFDIGDPQQAELGWRGSRYEWVKREPTFRQFLADTLSDEDLTRWFGTANLDEACLEEAGNGWLWGRSRDYRKWMEQRYSPRELEKMFGAVDLSQWGLRTPEDRALWAETKLFWGSSICDNLAFIKRVGAEVRGDFYVLPNWGQMQTFDSTEFREEIAHIVESWAPAMDAMMYEEDGEPGRIAHGLYLDHLLQQKLALALGVVQATISSRGAHEGADELAQAQALAAGGGAYIQCGERYASTRARYRAFIDDNPALFEGFRSYADIAVGAFFRELHMENHAQLRQVFQFIRYLTDQHVLFDLIVEKQLAPEVLSDYRVLILPAARYLSDAEVAAAGQFAASGGLLVLTGDAGCCDEACKPRSANAFAGLLEGMRRSRGIGVSRDGRCIQAEHIAALIGADNVSREDGLSFTMYSAASLNVPGGRRAAAAYELDRMIGVDRYYEPAALIPRIERCLGHRVRLAEGRANAGVYFHAYRKENFIVLHAVNYNVPITEDPHERTVYPITGLKVTLPLPADFTVNEVVLREVGGPEKPVRHQLSGGLLRFTIPQLRVHQIAVIR